MREALAVRDEIQGMIDSMPEQSLYELRPLILDFIANAPDNDDTLSEEELKLLDECRRERKENPESFMSIDEYMETRGIK